MKIAFFVNAFPIVSEAFIATSAAELIGSGHQVDVFGLGSDRPSQAASPAASRYNLLERARNAEVPESLPERLAGLPGAITDIIATHGPGSLPVFHPRAYRRSLTDLSAFYRLRVIPRKAEYDILHCQFGTLAEHVLKLRQAGKLSGKVVVHFRGYDISEIVQRCGRSVYDHVWARADRIITNYGHFRDIAIGLGAPPAKVDVIGSGIDLDNFTFRPPLPVGDGPIRLFVAGRLVERKGVHVALDSLALLRNAGHDMEIDVVGDGEERDALRQQAKALNIAHVVRFHGAKTHGEIADFLHKAHIAIAPSMRSRYGGMDAPLNTIKEAMACGVPVVATRHAGIPELVTDGETGILADENDADDLARAITRLLSLQDGWAEMTAKARGEVEARYDINLTTPMTLKSYEAALSKSTEKPFRSASRTSAELVR